MRKLDAGTRTTWITYVKDKDFKELRRKFDPAFNEKFGEGYKNYISGNWSQAEELFSQCLKMNP